MKEVVGRRRPFSDQAGPRAINSGLAPKVSGGGTGSLVDHGRLAPLCLRLDRPGSYYGQGEDFNLRLGES